MGNTVATSNELPSETDIIPPPEGQTVNYTIVRNKRSATGLLDRFDPEIKTLFDNFRAACEKYPNNRCLAWRKTNELTGQREDYICLTYANVQKNVQNFGSFLVNELHLPVGDRIGVWSVNRPEWDLSEEACNAYGFVSVPLYNTLGPDAVKYVLNHAEIKTAVVAASRIPELLKVVSETMLERLICMDGVPDDLLQSCTAKGLKVWSFQQAVKTGRSNIAAYRPPKPEDIASLIYTSGTTGNPKGVIHTHSTIIAAMAGLLNAGIEFKSDDKFLSYLPAAHIYARICHKIFLAFGAAIMYFSNNLLELFSGDCVKSRPTFFAGVPRVYGKLYSKITDGVSSAGGLKKKLYDFAYSSQLEALKNGTTSAFANFFFGKIKEKVGLTDARIYVSGSAPLDPVVQLWVQVVFGPCLQGYGLTETGAALTAQRIRPICPSGSTGVLLVCTEMRIDSVPEMDYNGAGNPPEGEIVVRGPNIFKGYYKNPEKTNEVLDPDGWFHTGDIGRLNEDGTLSIIDRKKNIFKLSQGEYVAPDYIQGVYSRSPFVAMCFIHGNSLKGSLLGIVVPDPDVLKRWGQENGKQTEDMAALCQDPDAVKAVFDSMTIFGNEAKLRGFEKVKALYLEPVVWAVPLLTPTFKLVRNKLAKHYEEQINQMYAQIESK